MVLTSDSFARLIDALEMMKQGAKRLLVPKSLVWRGMSKRFSILYNGKWLKNVDSFGNSSTNTLANAASRPSSSSTSSIQDKFCCLSREDVLRFLIGCLGALAPLPLSSIASLEAVNPNYCWIEASSPAIDATKKLPHDPCAAAVVELTPEGQHKMIGEISSAKLWKCDYLSTAWALARLSAGQFIVGAEDHMNSSRSLLPHENSNSDEIIGGEESNAAAAAASAASNNNPPNRLRRKFSSRSIGFFSNTSDPNLSMGRSMYRGRSAPLTCKVTSSLAAVMAQMLSHRATHVWVTTEDENDDVLVGVVGYTDILAAVTRQPAAAAAPTFLEPSL